MQGLGTFTSYVLIFAKLLENILKQNEEKRKETTDPGSKEVNPMSRKGKFQSNSLWSKMKAQPGDTGENVMPTGEVIRRKRYMEEKNGNGNK